MQIACAVCFHMLSICDLPTGPIPYIVLGRNVPEERKGCRKGACRRGGGVGGKGRPQGARVYDAGSIRGEAGSSGSLVRIGLVPPFVLRNRPGGLVGPPGVDGREVPLRLVHRSQSTRCAVMWSHPLQGSSAPLLRLCRAAPPAHGERQHVNDNRNIWRSKRLEAIQFGLSRKCWTAPQRDT